jgi:hypothetical protein
VEANRVVGHQGFHIFLEFGSQMAANILEILDEKRKNQKTQELYS